MDKKFLKFIATEYIAGDRFCKGIPSTDGIIRRLEKYMSESVVEEIADAVYDYTYDLALHSVLNGMQLAIEVMDGVYIHEVH